MSYRDLDLMALRLARKMPRAMAGGHFSALVGQSTSLQSGPTSLLTASIELGPSVLTTLHTTPVVMLKAPGAGLWYQALDVVSMFHFGGVAYTGTGLNALQLFRGSNPASQPTGSIVMQLTTSSFFNATSDVVSWQQGNASPGGVPARSTLENQPLTLFITGNNLATGNGVYLLNLVYRIIPLPPI